MLHPDIYFKIDHARNIVSEMNPTLNVIYQNRHFIKRSITCTLQHKSCNEKNNPLCQYLVPVYAISCLLALEIQRDRLQRGLGLPTEVK